MGLGMGINPPDLLIMDSDMQRQQMNMNMGMGMGNDMGSMEIMAVGMEMRQPEMAMAIWRDRGCSIFNVSRFGASRRSNNNRNVWNSSIIWRRKSWRSSFAVDEKR
jgi:hypothetical protein